MTPGQHSAGAAIVGTMEMLPLNERMAVHCLRCRYASQGCPLPRLLQDHGVELSAAMEPFCTLLEAYGRRPLHTLAVGEEQLSADEATIAHCLAAAGSFQRDEVLMFAMLLCRADVAPCLAGEAEALALRLRQTRNPLHKTSTFIN